MVNTKMKKRAVSPVIATVLLIALVTAAAAIVFLVVIPMLNPSPQAIVIGAIDVTENLDGNFTIIVTIQAQSADLTFNGTITSAPVVAYLSPDTSTGYAIANGATGQITVTGSFVSGTEYKIIIYFSAGDSTIFATATFTPVST